MGGLANPATRPANPRFSSGPCAKPPGFSFSRLSDAPLGRSHRASACKAKLKAVIDGTRELLGIPEGYRVGIVPASNTGAFEMAMWNLLGARPVEMAAWESFGAGWARDAVEQLNLDTQVREAPYGSIVDMTALDYDRDVCFVWNGTTSGVRMPSGEAIPADRGGLTLCDATSAAFAMDLPWDKLDAVTFSWQKALGGEAAHGMLVLSPRAADRLETHAPPWPVPKIFRLTKGGKLIEGVFRGETINTPSMMAAEDFLAALDWARSAGGLPGLISRVEANAAVIGRFVNDRDWIAYLAKDPVTRSPTSVCLQFVDPRASGDAGFAREVARLLEVEGAAFDVGAHRDAPPGLRVWCGCTVEAADLEALTPWLDWAYAKAITDLTEAA